MPLNLSKRQYGSKEELGREIQALRPELRGRDPVQLAERLLASPAGRGVTVAQATPRGYTDISPWRALGNVPGDALKTLGEEVGGIVEAVSHPIDTTVGLGKVAGGGFDVLTGNALDLARPESEQAARSLVEEMAQSVSPEGLQERPVRAAVNASSLVSPKGILKILSKAGAVGRAGRVAATAAGIPARMRQPFAEATEAAAGLGRATGRATRGLYGKASTAMTGAPRGLGSDVRDAIVGFTSSQGARSTRALFEEVSRNPKRARTFKAYRNAARPSSGLAVKAQDRILVDTLQAYDRLWERNQKTHGTALDNLAVLDAEVGAVTLPTPGGPVKIMDNLVAELRGELSDFGVQLRWRAPRAPGPGTRAQPGRWSVGWDEAFADAINPVDRNVVKRHVESLLNQKQGAKLRALHMDRRELDNLIRMLPDDSRAGTILMRTRGVLQDTLYRFIQDPDYRREMGRYAKERARLDLVRQEFAIPHERVLDRLGRVHWGKGKGQWRGNMVTALKDAYSDAERKHIRPQLLDVLEREGGARNLSAKILGYNYEDIFGSGLVPKGQFSQGVRGALGSLTPAAIGGAAGGFFAGVAGGIAGAAMGLPFVFLYSPRFASQLVLSLEKRLRQPPNPGKVRRAAAAMQRRAQMLFRHPVAGPIVRQAMQQGWSMEKTFESLQQQGVDVDALLDAEKPSYVRAPPRRSMLGSLSTMGVPYGQLRSR